MNPLILTLFILSHGSSEPFRYRQLTWEDFRASKPLGKDAVAETAAHLVMTTTILDGKETYEVYTEVLPDESFTATDRPDILRHEQTHLDVFEIMCRKCIRAIAPYQNKSSSYEPKVKRILDYYSKEIDSMNDCFDRDTHHSEWTVVEARWEKLILNDLNKLQ